MIGWVGGNGVRTEIEWRSSIARCDDAVVARPSHQHPATQIFWKGPRGLAWGPKGGPSKVGEAFVVAVGSVRVHPWEMFKMQQQKYKQYYIPPPTPPPFLPLMSFCKRVSTRIITATRAFIFYFSLVGLVAPFAWSACFLGRC